MVRTLSTRLLLMLFCTLSATGAWANKRDYARGVEAAGSGDWARVQQLMSNALADDAEPKDRALMYGTYRRPYIPQYYLALAAMNRNDCAAALRFLDDARLTALLGSGGRATAEATETAAIRRRCATPISGTSSSASSVAAPLPTATLSAAQRQSAQRALDELLRASTQAKARVPLQNLSKALTESAQAQAAVENAVLAGDGASLQRALQLASGASRELNRLSAAAGSTASSASSASSVAATPAPSKVEAAAGLKSALAAFLSGDYQTVVRSETRGMDPRSTAHTLLLRAAARYSLFLLGGERDANLRSQAEVDIRDARRALNGIRPATAYFSPRFVRFFEQTR